MPKYTVIDTEGNILRSGGAPSSHIQLQAGVGETALEIESSDTLHWVDTGTMQRQDKIPFPITTTGNTITGIPTGTTLGVEGQSQTITDGSVTYNSNRKGDHRLVLTHREYLTEVVVILI